MGIPATGRTVEMTGQAFYNFRDGKVTERLNNVDIMGLMVQLGAIPAPA